MLARCVLCLAFAFAAGCTHEQARHAMLAGEIASLTGVAGLIGGVLATPHVSSGHGHDLIVGFSVVSAADILMYAIGEIEDPAFATPAPETDEQRNHRWARVLTQRAAGAAREHDCDRVRRLEPRIRAYDPEVHDFVLLADPEVVRCLQAPEPPAP
jgi:hypothetical protein